MAKYYEECPACDGSGEVCGSCGESCDGCECDEPDMCDCDACDGEGEIPCDERENY